VNWKLQTIFVLLFFIFIALQYRLWVGEGSLAEMQSLQGQLQQQTFQLQELQQINKSLKAELKSLKNNDAAFEARARRELGMIKEGETYFQLIKPEKNDRK
tara:strand:+ start:792 stop:1094 length:303 start_codon:yes stop_codon:yes gene_type:complete